MNINIGSRSKQRMLIVKKYSQKKKMNAFLNAKASLAIEGLHLSPQEEQLILKRVKGELNNKEFISRAFEIAKNV